MINAHGLQRRMQVANAVLQPSKTFGGLAFAHIEAVQICRRASASAGTGGIAKKRLKRSRGRDQASAENNAIRFEQAPPQVRKVDRVKGTFRRKSNGLELRGGERRGRRSEER